MRLFEHCMDPVFGVGAGLHQRHPRPRQIASGTERGGRHNAGAEQAMRQPGGDPGGSRFVGLCAGPGPDVAGVPSEPLDRPHEDVRHRAPIHARALQSNDRTVVRGTPVTAREQLPIGGKDIFAQGASGARDVLALLIHSAQRWLLLRTARSTSDIWPGCSLKATSRNALANSLAESSRKSAQCGAGIAIIMPS